MNSSSRHRRVLPDSVSDDAVYLLGHETRRAVDLPEPVATAATLVSAAEDRVRRAEAEAELLLAQARREAEALKGAGRREGYEAGRSEGIAEAEDETRRYLELVRRAAEEGRAIRDGIVEQSANVIARAAMLVARRIVGEYYEAEGGRTGVAVEEAIRAAAAQQVLSIRVHPSTTAAVQARLSDVAAIVSADETIEIGGCLIDLKHGQIDASLDARFTMMELALERATGGVA